MVAIFKRELKSYFSSPLGYIILLVYLAMYGWVFSQLYAVGVPQTALIFSYFSFITAFLIPVLTMRLFSEERRQKTDRALFTAPVSITSIVMGKFLAALAMFGMSQAITLVYQTIFAFNVTVDWVNYFSYLIGTILMAAALISVGLFISCLTDSQIVAAVISIAVSVLLFSLDGFFSGVELQWVAKVVEWISFQGRYNTFIEGLFDLANTVYSPSRNLDISMYHI